MTDPAAALAALRRPKLLIRAARFALVDYERNRDLRRLLHHHTVPGPKAAFEWLLEQENDLEDARLGASAAYSPGRHVEVLTALIAEARLLAPRPEPEAPAPTAATAPLQPNMSGSAALRSATKASRAARTAGSSGGAS